jgi:hypothetical protein
MYTTLTSPIETNNTINFNFNNHLHVSNWRIINDAVMGGKSEGKFVLNDKNQGEFKGFVSLENNGGFTFLRHRFDKTNIANCTKVILQVKGDGKKYQFRLKADKNDQHAYVTYFQTTNNWEFIEISLAQLEPTFRGKKLMMDNFDGVQIEEFGFLIANKTNENFQLTINSVMFK